MSARESTAIVQTRIMHLLSVALLSLGVLSLSSCTGGQQTKRDMKTPPPWGICTSVKNAEIMKAAGYSYVEGNVKRFLVPQEPDEAFETILDEAGKASLEVYSYNGFIPGSLKSTGPKPDHDEILKYAERAFRRGQQAGSKIIVFG